jgi:predicted tellurium resistance membrane protein TerC
VWIALATLTALEIALGIDTIIFISILVGFALVAEGLHFHLPKGYIYFAMAYSVAVEMLNLRVRAPARRSPAVRLRKAVHESTGSGGGQAPGG